MDTRVVEFVSALRSRGVRVSLAESADSMHAIEAIGVYNRQLFKNALKATLIKEPADVPAFELLFPYFFGSEGQPPQQPQGLSPQQQEQLQRALQQLRQQLQQLMRMLANGEQPSQDQMDQYSKQAGIANPMHNMRMSPLAQQWMVQRMLREMGLTPQQLQEAIEALMQQLKEQGMNSQGRQEVKDTVEQNAEGMREQVSRYVGQNMYQQPDDNPHRQRIDDLMNRPLSSLTDAEMDELRNHVRRLVARLRSRAALRMRHAREGDFDVKSTIRYNLRYGGVPLELRFKRHHLKPKLTVIVDVSTSMRPVTEFMLRMVYEMQDQVSKARSFAFIDDLHDISLIFVEHRPEEAIPIVLHELPPGHYNTDLGNSLCTFCQNYLDTVDRRTTLIFVGDGRNNYNDPRLDLVNNLKMRARRIIWMNPEPPNQWGEGDSDMAAYAPLCDAVHQVATLQQLADAIDDLFQRR